MEDVKVSAATQGVVMQTNEVITVAPSSEWGESATEAHGEAGGLSLEDCMDMVVSYRCKFCNFTASSPHAIRIHVSKIHVQRPENTATAANSLVLPSNRFSDKSVISGNDGNMAGHVTHLYETVAPENGEVVGTSLPVEPVVGQDQQPSIGVVSGQALDEGSYQTETSLNQSGENYLTVGRQGHILVQENGIFQSPLDIRGQTVTLLPSSNDTATVAVEEAVAPPGGEVTEALVLEESVDGQLQLDSEAGNGVVANKELFLCGQCNLGFTNIEDCKMHMVQDHNLNMDSVQEAMLDETMLPVNSVSIGTQVEDLRKKPGRKKKGEKPPEPENPEDKQIDSEEENIEVFETTSKRKVRPPRGLTQLYYLTKTKKSTRNPPKFPRERYRLLCSKSGCHARFYTQTSLDLHVKCHVESSDGPTESFQCVCCSQLFPGWRQLRLHLWRQHTVDTDLYRCPTCQFRSDNTHKMTVHMEIHSEERPYACDICGKCFKQLNQMRTHRIVHGDRSILMDPSWYNHRQCEICKRVFASRKCMQRHVEAVHSDERPFQCPYCSHATTRKAMMDLHVRTHTGEKPFKCDQCTFATGDHNSLRRHRMRHSGEKPYKCQYCVYSCIQAISLKSHMKNKHPGCEGIFTCKLCPYRTVNDLCFKNHMKDHAAGLIHVVPPGDTSGQQAKASGRSRRAGIKLDSDARSENPVEIVCVETGIQNGTNNFQGVEFNNQLPEGETLSKAGVNTTELIYSALNAIRQQTSGGQTELDTANLNQTMGGLQPSVSTSTQDGVTTHTITFQIPNGGQSGDSTSSQSSPLVLHVQPITSTTETTKMFQQTSAQSTSMQNANGDSQFVDILQVDELGNIPGGAHIVEISGMSGEEGQIQAIVTEAGLQESVNAAEMHQTVDLTDGQVQQQAIQLLPATSASHLEQVNISSSHLHEVTQQFQQVVSESEPQLHIHADSSGCVSTQAFQAAQVMQVLQSQANELGESLVLQAGGPLTTAINNGNQEQNLLILHQENTDSGTVQVTDSESMEVVQTQRTCSQCDQ